LYGFVRTVSNLYWRIVICLVPTVLSGIIVGRAIVKYNAGEGGFKLGADLAGGTKLVYEIDPDRKPENYKKEDLATALKKRIDPADLYNIEIRTLGDTHVEIILPTGSAHQAEVAEAAWQEVLKRVQSNYASKLGNEELDANRGQARELMQLVEQKIRTKEWSKLLAAVGEKFPKVKENKDIKLESISVGRTAELSEKLRSANLATEAELKTLIESTYQPVKFEDVEKYVNDVYPPSQQRKDLTAEEIESIKQKIQAVGSMEFLILANQIDDRDVVNALQEHFDTAKNATLVEDLEQRALRGLPPPLPAFPAGERSWPTTRPELGNVTYRWVEVGKQERKSLGLDNASEAAGGANWQQAATDRAANRVTVLSGMNQVVLFSRKCQSARLSEADRNRKKFEYFLLCREPDVVDDVRQTVTGKELVSAHPTTDRKGDPVVGFEFNNLGGDRFFNVTNKNLPNQNIYRHLAILLDDQIVSAPRLNEAIRSNGQISGNFTAREVDQMVSILRSGALPATLKPKPTGENQISPGLGADTTKNGILSVVVAFSAVLVFMCIYYRFAGMVASVALLANLLLTIAFMVFVNATFTLQALAGLVLMLGMAVDANVLIYERLREERDRGANLIVALRNAYDRALPTILDTHLTSIFTSIILYAFGDSRLKGFGVSLFAGLVISLFTSLFMTRTIFDLWMKMNLLKKLGMFRMLTKPNVNFMRIRHYWFTATITVSILSVILFMWRGSDSLDIDFIGGTSFGGQLKDPANIGQLRQWLSKESQEKLLKVDRVEQRDDAGNIFAITFSGGSTSVVELATRAHGNSKEEREKDVTTRASKLEVGTPTLDLSRTEGVASGSSKFFNVSTREKERDLVLVILNRLLVDDKGQSLLQRVPIEKIEYRPKQVVLHFADYASPGAMTDLVRRELVSAGVRDPAFDISGLDRSRKGRHKTMLVDLSGPMFSHLTQQDIQKIFVQTEKDYNERPPYDQLNTIDAVMAEDALTKALYAIIASWVVILMYLWFRFGSWKFGAAAVLCLIHDLVFTIGIIVFCHYIVDWVPWLAGILKIDDFKINMPAIAALLTLAGYSVNDTIVVFDRIREVRGKNPLLTSQMINDSANQTLSRTLLASLTVWLVVLVLYWFGGEGVHLFAFVMVVGVVIGTYSSIYIASPLLLIFGEGASAKGANEKTAPEPEPEDAPA
jgi:SecD/SecF fusion protein